MDKSFIKIYSENLDVYILEISLFLSDLFACSIFIHFTDSENFTLGFEIWQRKTQSILSKLDNENRNFKDADLFQFAKLWFFLRKCFIEKWTRRFVAKRLLMKLLRKQHKSYD